MRIFTALRRPFLPVATVNETSSFSGDFEIMEKDEVSFTVATGKNGRRKAVNIRILSK
jgi:hypothetical protein